MENIIKTEYMTEEDLNAKTTEALTAETNTIYWQMEAIGSVGIMMAAQAGKRLTVIKGRLQHGEWEEWAKNNLSFSVRKANRMMALAEKTEEENTLFSNPTTLSDLGISKVWALLSAPEDVAEAAASNPDAQEMSVKEFQKEIRRLTEEKEALKNAEKEAEALRAELAATKDDKTIEDLRRKLETEKEKNKKQKESAKAETNRAVKEAEVKAAEKAEAAAAEKFAKETEELKNSYMEAVERADKLERRLANSSNTDLAEFKVYVDQLQKDFSSCAEAISKVGISDEEQATNMKKALTTVMETMLKSL